MLILDIPIKFLLLKKKKIKTQSIVFAQKIFIQ